MTHQQTFTVILKSRQKVHTLKKATSSVAFWSQTDYGDQQNRRRKRKEKREEEEKERNGREKVQTEKKKFVWRGAATQTVLFHSRYQDEIHREIWNGERFVALVWKAFLDKLFNTVTFPFHLGVFGYTLCLLEGWGKLIGSYFSFFHIQKMLDKWLYMN